MLSETLYNHFVEETNRFAGAMIFNESKWDLKWEKGLMMDVGCGTNQISTEFIWRRYSSIKKIYSIDHDPEVIRYFRRCNKLELLEYIKADITCWDNKIYKKGCKISKVISLRCLDEVKNQQQAFENIFRLLKRGGDMLILMTINSYFYELINIVIQRDRWRKYFSDFYAIPKSHTRRYTAEYYMNMLHSIGFVQITISEMPRIVFYRNISDFIIDVCHWSLCSSIPEEYRQDFAMEVFTSSDYYCSGMNTTQSSFNILSQTLWIHAGKPV